jgi:hypothetical protein
MKNTNSTILKLFNGVLASKTEGTPEFIQEFGTFISSDAAYACAEIKEHLKNLKLSGNDLNKTFYKSWDTVKNSSDLEIRIDQLFHYMSTYGTNHEGEVYIPEQVLNIPDLKLKVCVISSLTEEQVIARCLDILCSGIALHEDTLKEIFNLLNNLKYAFTGKEGIRNKEANILIADKFNIFPESPEEFLRYVLFKTTDSTSLVKSADTIALIKESKKDVSSLFADFGVKKLASVFNRFKLLFLAFKSANSNNSKIINKIAKLSKTLHKPMVSNPLNAVTFSKLTSDDEHWLDNATTFALFKSLSACYTRINGQDSFVYRVRNGKSWTRKGEVNLDVCRFNYTLILEHLKGRVKGEGRNVFIPENIVYALPTSEKLFVGNIPTGTKFLGEKLAAGIYWETSWGADDLDLSGLNIGGKIGWNSTFNDAEHGLTYSGDVTDAHNGAAEYMHIESGHSNTPTLVMNNVYHGDAETKYKIVVGEAPKVSENHMMNPNELIIEVMTQSVQKNTILGLIMAEKNNMNSFTLLNFGAGTTQVSGDTEINNLAMTALFQQWSNSLSLNEILTTLGFNVYHEKTLDNQELMFDFNLEVDKLTKSTFIELFK